MKFFQGLPVVRLSNIIKAERKNSCVSFSKYSVVQIGQPPHLNTILARRMLAKEFFPFQIERINEVLIGGSEKKFRITRCQLDLVRVGYST